MLRVVLFIVFINSLLSAKTVLVIGDSMVEAINKPIVKIFKNNNIDCKVHFKRGTRVDYWIENKNLFLDESIKPDVALISLGTNDLIAKKTNKKIITELETLIEIMTSIGVERENILIVAPPIYDDKGLNDDLLTHFGKQAFLSREINLSFAKDNIHPTMPSNVVWAASIVDYMASSDRLAIALTSSK